MNVLTITQNKIADLLYLGATHEFICRFNKLGPFSWKFFGTHDH